MHSIGFTNVGFFSDRDVFIKVYELILRKKTNTLIQFNYFRSSFGGKSTSVMSGYQNGKVK